MKLMIVGSVNDLSDPMNFMIVEHINDSSSYYNKRKRQKGKKEKEKKKDIIWTHSNYSLQMHLMPECWNYIIETKNEDDLTAFIHII